MKGEEILALALAASMMAPLFGYLLQWVIGT